MAENTNLGEILLVVYWCCALASLRSFAFLRLDIMFRVVLARCCPTTLDYTREMADTNRKFEHPLQLWYPNILTLYGIDELSHLMQIVWTLFLRYGYRIGGRRMISNVASLPLFWTLCTWPLERNLLKRLNWISSMTYSAMILDSTRDAPRNKVTCQEILRCFREPSLQLYTSSLASYRHTLLQKCDSLDYTASRLCQALVSRHSGTSSHLQCSLISIATSL